MLESLKNLPQKQIVHQGNLPNGLQYQSWQQSQQNPQVIYLQSRPPVTPPNNNSKKSSQLAGIIHGSGKGGQMTVSDIKNMTQVQRVNIFKLLQRREKSKFINIQQQKFAKIEQSIMNQDSSADYFKKGEDGKGEKFVDIVRKQNLKNRHGGP